MAFKSKIQKKINDNPISHLAKPSVRSRALDGSIWVLITFGVSFTAGFFNNIILASLLSPAILGMMKLVDTCFRGLNMFSDVGITPSIIHHTRGEEEAFLNTAWTIQVIRGFGLAIALVIFAWPAAFFYDEPMLMQLLPAISMAAIIIGFLSTSIPLLLRRMEIGKERIFDLTSNVLGIAIMITLAWLLRTIWAIIISWTVMSILKVFASHCLLRIGPSNRFCWDKNSARQLFHYGKWIFISTAITFFAGNLDILIIGKLLGVSTLGVYSIARIFAHFPNMIGNLLCSKILFPVISAKMRDAPEQIGRYIIEGRDALLPVMLLGLLAIFCLCPPLIELFFDDRYVDATWMVQILVVPGWFACLRDSINPIFPAMGDTRSIFFCNIVDLIGTTIGMIGGFYLIEFPGLLLGMALGPIAGSITGIIFALHRSIHLFWQSFYYTCGLLTMSILGIVGPELAEQYLNLPVRIWKIPVIPFLILMLVGLWTFHRVSHTVLGIQLSELWKSWRH